MVFTPDTPSTGGTSFIPDKQSGSFVPDVPTPTETVFPKFFPEFFKSHQGLNESREQGNLVLSSVPVKPGERKEFWSKKSNFDAVVFFDKNSPETIDILKKYPGAAEEARTVYNLTNIVGFAYTGFQTVKDLVGSLKFAKDFYAYKPEPPLKLTPQESIAVKDHFNMGTPLPERLADVEPTKLAQGMRDAGIKPKFNSLNVSKIIEKSEQDILASRTPLSAGTEASLKAAESKGFATHPSMGGTSTDIVTPLNKEYQAAVQLKMGAEPTEVYKNLQASVPNRDLVPIVKDLGIDWAKSEVTLTLPQHTISQAVAETSQAIQAGIREVPKVVGENPLVPELKPQGLSKVIDKVYNNKKVWDSISLNPETMFLELDGFKEMRLGQELAGKNYETLWKPVLNAQENTFKGESLINTQAEELMKQNKLNFYNIEHGRVQVGDLTLTPSEKLKVFAIQSQPGGIETLTKDGMELFYHKGTTLFTPQQLEQIKLSMTPEDVAQLKFMSKYFEKVYPELKTIVRLKTGEELGSVENYFPIFRETKFTDTAHETEISLFNSVFKPTTIRPGITKHRVGGGIPIREGGAWQDFFKYVKLSERYKNYALVEKDVNKIISNNQWRSAVISAKGEPYYETLKTQMGRIFNPNMEYTNDIVNKTAREIRINSVKAISKFNMAMAGQQVASITTVMDYAGISETLDAIRQVALHPTEMAKFVSERSTVVKMRQDYFDVDKMIVRSGRDKVSFSDKWGYIGFNIIDGGVTNSSWLAGYNKGLKTFGNEQKAIEMADSLVRRTQPVPGIEHQYAAITGNELNASLAPFTSQMNKLKNYEYAAIKGRFRVSKDEFYWKVFKFMMSEIMYRMIPALAITAITDRDAYTDRPMNILGHKVPAYAKLPIYMMTYNWQGIYILSMFSLGMNLARNEGIGLPIALRPLDYILKGSTNALQGKYGLGALNVAKGIGTATGFPVVATERFGKGAYDLLTGKTKDLSRLILSPFQTGETYKKKSKGFLK